MAGLPISLSGKIGPQAKSVEAFLKELRQHRPIPVDTWDERYSTAEAGEAATPGRP